VIDVALESPQVGIICNRCGDCCEQVILWRPLDLVLAVRDGRLDGKAVAVSGLTVAWFLDLVYQGQRDGRHVYRCRRFRREEDGTGTCTRYDERPGACSGFPYGRPVTGPDWYAPRCAWKCR